ncbi:MAG: TolC family protein [Bacteroidales bacterium]|jgi:cobalt-zinc-cadmium efflux system outer membrane protein
MLRIIILLFSVCFIAEKVEAQKKNQADTLLLSLQDAETFFLKNNFDLLAAKYQIAEADAAVIQAKLWDNPNLNFEQGAYNSNTKKWFDISESGETAVILQQLIYLAGKRDKRINIEKINSQIANYQFYDLMRALRYELRTSFFEFYFLEKSLSVYDRELAALKSLVDAYTIEYKKGNIPFKELARLQSLQFNLENEKIDVLKNLTERQSNIILLTGDTLSRPIKPVLNISAFDSINPESLSLGQLLDWGLSNRYDLKISEAKIQSEQMNLSLQKAMRIPDMTLGARYDKAGSYVHNYNSLSLGFDLPLWNRNQGNIKIAENKIEESKTLKNQKELEVKNDINKAYVQLLETDKLYKLSLQKFDSNYDNLFDGITSAYQNHTISLLEFIDYYETYKNSKSEYYQLQNNRLDAMENLNMATGTIIIK